MTRERWFQVGGAAFIAFFLVTFNNVPFVNLLRTWPYYRDLLITLTAAFLLFQYISFVTGLLDDRVGWESGHGKRITAQLVIGLGGSCLLAYGIAFLQYAFIDPDHVFGTDSFLQTEFPVIVLFLTFVNILYTGLSYYLRNRPEALERPGTLSEETVFAGSLIGIHGQRRINVPLDAVGLISVQDGITWLFTFDNARYHLDEPLHQIMQRLDPARFFRANRQNIVQLSACYSYQSLDYGKIRLVLVPPFGTELTISQKTAPAFRKWMERQDITRG
ncbi:LytTR family DNA-binding domain-containing protein [Larkinella soli]|uniref:LytTR family DNA-binding domain-containing protein n=1 Tax=Larkinella soli TaxID=1770527 RepID=UPI000FFC3831|nr:LytTR family DNA-binding domain-containing protein [Larkinella soli]